MNHYSLSDWIIIASVFFGIACILSGFILMKTLKHSERSTLNAWRKTLSVGDKVMISDGAVKFNAQIVYIWEDRMKVISNDMRVAAYPYDSIYPQE